MKQTSKLLLCLLSLLLLALNIYATSELNPYRYYISGQYEPKELYKPLSLAEFYFNENISVDGNAIAKLQCGDVIIAEGKLSARSFNNDGIATVTFDNSIILEKDRNYRITIPANCIRSLSNPNITSNEISVAFKVPMYLHCSYTMIDSSEENEDGTYKQYPVATERYFYFCFPTEIEHTDGAMMTLLREGLPIMQIPVTANYDFDLGTAWGHFEHEMNFEKNVHYSFVLTKGSVKSIYRDDIVNTECQKDFVGAYSRNFSPIEYDSYDIEGQNRLIELNNVNIRYSRPIALTPNARLQLLSVQGNILKEASVVLSEENGQYRISADFGGYKLTESDGYILCIPEATVVGTGADIVVNQQALIPLGKHESGVDEIVQSHPKMSVDGNILCVTNVAKGTHMSIYSTDGVLVYNSTTTTQNVIVALPKYGLYVLRLVPCSSASCRATPYTTIFVVPRG